MTSDTLTRARPLGHDDGDYIVRTNASTTSSDSFPDSDTVTWSLARMTKNAMLPVLFGLASIGAPVVPGVRRVFSGAAISRSALVADEWLLDADAFYFTRETADPDEVRALNALLYLPATSGLELDLPE